MLLQFPFISHQKLNRALLFSACIPYKPERLGRKGLNLFMEKDYNPAPGIFSSTFALEQDCEYKGKMYSSVRQLLLCITVRLEIISVHDRELQDLSPACKSFPTPSCMRNSFYTASCVTDHRLFHVPPLWAPSTPRGAAAPQSSVQLPRRWGVCSARACPRHELRPWGQPQGVLVAVASKRLSSPFAVTQGRGRPKIFMPVCTLCTIDFFIYLFT